MARQRVDIENALRGCVFLHHARRAQAAPALLIEGEHRPFGVIGERIVAAPFPQPAIDDFCLALPQVATAEGIEHQNVHEQGGEGGGRFRPPARDGVEIAREACRLR